MTPNSRANIVPWESDDFGDHRKDLSFLNSLPSINHQPPSATLTSSPFLKDPTPQYGRNNRPTLPSNLFSNTSSFHDPHEDYTQLSPGFQPKPMNGDLTDDRRPSIASTSTVSSQGSKRSHNVSTGRFHKKLQGFFGDEYGNTDNRAGSESSLPMPQGDAASAMERTNSIPGVRPSSPASLRPRTPGPSSEVTPWVFQDSEVCFVHNSRKAINSVATASGNGKHHFSALLPSHPLRIRIRLTADYAIIGRPQSTRGQRFSRYQA